MLSSQLEAKLRPHCHKSLISILKKSKGLEFTYGSSHYTVYDQKACFEIDDVESDGNIAMSVLHEIGHFLQCKPERILLNDYGFRPGTTGKSLTALKCEMQTITISLALAAEFEVPVTPYWGVIDTLECIAKWRNISAESQHRYLGQIFMNVQGLDVDELLEEFQDRDDYVKYNAVSQVFQLKRQR